MESTLHRQLKALYAGQPTRCEQWVDGYRIDAIRRGTLIEIQQASLSALRDKVRALVASHRVLVVKPLFTRKLIVRHDPHSGEILSQRVSPSHASVWDLFLDLVHFVDVFPHPRLSLEVVLTEVTEYRADRPQRRRRSKAYRVSDRQVTEILQKHRFKTATDLRRLLPADLLGEPFTTADLATATELPRWWAQKVAYCLRKTGAIDVLGKRGHAVLYGPPARTPAARKAA